VTDSEFHGLTRNSALTTLNRGGRAGFGSERVVHQAAGDGRTRGRSSIKRGARCRVDQTRPRWDRCEHEKQDRKAHVNSHMVGLPEQWISIPASRVAGRLPSASESSRSENAKHSETISKRSDAIEAGYARNGHDACGSQEGSTNWSRLLEESRGLLSRGRWLAVCTERN
jgi:hypothetical protein